MYLIWHGKGRICALQSLKRAHFWLQVAVEEWPYVVEALVMTSIGIVHISIKISGLCLGRRQIV